MGSLHAFHPFSHSLGAHGRTDAHITCSWGCLQQEGEVDWPVFLGVDSGPADSVSWEPMAGPLSGFQLLPVLGVPGLLAALEQALGRLCAEDMAPSNPPILCYR